MRLFVAIDPPPAAREVVRERLAPLPATLPRARWVEAARAHLTLVFLGEQDQAVLDPLVAALTEEARRTEPFELRLVDGGTFPPRRPARVAWIGVDAPDTLEDLQRRLDTRTAELLDRDADERPFHPHVTVARPKQRWGRKATERFGEAARGPWGEPFTVEEIVLYSSELHPDGARHTAEHRIALSGV